MKYLRITYILLILGILFFPGICIEASGSEWDASEEESYYQELKDKSPEAAEHFRSAGEALDRNELVTAANNYRIVIALVPDFAPAFRRLSYITVNDLEAVELAFKAFGLDRHPYNKKAVAKSLIRSTIRYYKKAQTYAKEAADELPKDVKAQALLCHIAFINEDFQTFKQALSRLKQLEPGGILTHYYLAKEAVVDKRWTDAEAELLRARQLGLSAKVAEALSTEYGIRYNIIRSRLLLYLPDVLWVLAIWLGFLLLLLAVGKILSRLTLASLKKQPPLKNKDIPPGEKRMRFVYSVVLLLTIIYFYISIPMSILLVIVLFGGIILSFPYMGQFPILPVFGTVVFIAANIWVILKSLFIRCKAQGKGPGLRLEEISAPMFFALLREMSQKVGPARVDTVFVIPEANIAIFERGSLWKHLRGNTEKCLTIGLGILKGMTRKQLKVLLAHELGHLNNNDYQVGSLAFHVRWKIYSFMKFLSSAGMDNWLNPVWIFLKSFYPVFQHISHGASRFEEFMADRFAALNYGIKPFIRSFRHIVRRYIEFELITLIEIIRADKEERQIRNIYRLNVPDRWPHHFQQVWPRQLFIQWWRQWPEHVPLKGTKKDFIKRVKQAMQEMSPIRMVEALYHEAMNDDSSPLDSHPSPQERIRYIMRLGHNVDARDNKEQAWGLFNFSRAFLEDLAHQFHEKKKREWKLIESKRLDEMMKYENSE
jgi:Zn-dependent protease with chaperone function